MSRSELEKMQNTGRVQESVLNGVTSVIVPPNSSIYKNAPAGDIFVEFDVPESCVRSLATNGYGKIYGPNSIFSKSLGIKEMPQATNIEIIVS